ncbi:protein ENHANCED PSEUDOMONAS SUSCEPTIBILITY 1-like isoform X1 [Dioscorea cayenensis subsp. rotundata]|uniref:Protein ENHANCED PSEUDOMONAS SUSCEPTIBILITY 1-like isoform X1 n=1 Tax=Dioscorea cayennensis subsp. rotundata TaxID=55577 RepID=A0AB40ASS4_DIOCR|nr:protein ENHANCED PSEUDOMONAS SUSCEPTIBILITY 1-like isoform X1 [Dioscorea cayenensis subsp. rotundata]
MAIDEVHILSRCLVQPPHKDRKKEQQIIHLTPWDLKSISIGYIQKGILFSKPCSSKSINSIVDSLKSSFSLTLNHFFPLAGRLTVTAHESTPPSFSVCISCNDEGAEFIHAVANEVTISDIVNSTSVPPILQLFFHLNGAVNFEGQSLPLLSAQVTELKDGGIFIGCSFNHIVADGFSFWHFMNSWSEISRTSSHSITLPPSHERWFIDSCTPPIRLPFQQPQDLIKSYSSPQLDECALHFSAEVVAKLKAKANKEMQTNKISSLQALLAHVWRSVTRARCLKPDQPTGYFLAMGNRSRLDLPLPSAYMGNSLQIADAVRILAGELVGGSLGWAANLLNEAVASVTHDKIIEFLDSWPKCPSFNDISQFAPCDLFTGSSPRFDVYGNDFGWGKPIAVRSGGANKFDGKITVYPGPEKGSIALEICLLPHVLKRLMEDSEFMKMVSAL